jgi:phage/plasmid-like protein (TIGR03299 family)
MLENRVFDVYPGRDEAFAEAGHDYEVIRVPSGSEGGIVNPDTFTGPMVRVPSPDGGWEHRSYRRDKDENKLRIRGLREGHKLHGMDIKTVNKTYELVQNTVAWDLMDAVLSDSAVNRSLKVNYETGGVLEGGASCFLTAWIDQPFQVEGDNSPVYPYLFATWRHDGMGSFNFGETSVRIVCANTRGLAEGEADRRNKMYSFRHTKNVMERIEDVKMMLQGVMIGHNEFQALAEELAKIEVTETQREEFFARFIPYPESLLTVQGEASDRQVANIDRARAAVRTAINSPSVPEAHRLTGWGLYNAATEYLDHIRPTRGGASITASKYTESYVKRQINPNRAKDVLPAMIREVAAA